MDNQMQNPYAAPVYVAEETSFGYSAGRPEVPVVTPVRFAEVVRRAWAVYRTNKWNTFIGVIGADAVIVIVMFALQLVFGFGILAVFMLGGGFDIDHDPFFPGSLLTVMMVILSIGMYATHLMVIWCITGGMFRLLTGIARGEGRRDAYLFAFWDVMGRLAVFGLMLLVVLVPLLVLAAVIPDWVGLHATSGPNPGSLIGFVIALVTLTLGGLIATPGLWLIMDRRMGPAEALGFSLRMLGANVATVFALMLWSLLLAAAGLAVLGVGFIFWALPLMWLTFVVYCMMASGENVELGMRSRSV